MTEYADFGAPVGARTGLPARRLAGPAGTRLTRRGRLVVVVLAAGLLLAAFSLGRVDSQAAVPSDRAAQAALTQTVVMPGDTLWSIAQDLAPDNDPREVVAAIRALNDLAGGLVAGQQLLLPAVA
ncbi:MAG: LysM domain-containing protein [Mycobacteriales bacterium]|nr:LysM domain-containing protein [Mycobacteriales bacterium]